MMSSIAIFLVIGGVILLFIPSKREPKSDIWQGQTYEELTKTPEGKAEVERLEAIADKMLDKYM